MKRKIVLLDYNKEKIFNILDNFSNIVNGNRIITKYNNKIVSDVEISDRYFNFNFNDFVKTILSKIDNYFEPIKYTFRITKNYQELKIFSHAVEFENELYYKTLSILNSTDKTYALQVNIGLVHSKTYATFCISDVNENVSIKNKHFKASLPEVIEYFFESIQNLNLIIDEQVKFLEKISDTYISLFGFFNNYKRINDDGKVYSTDILKLKALLFLLKNNKEFYLKLNTNQIDIINDINIIFSKNIFNIDKDDIKVSSSFLFKSYMELFKNYNSSVCIRECNKFISVLKIC